MQKPGKTGHETPQPHGVFPPSTLQFAMFDFDGKVGSSGRVDLSGRRKGTESRSDFVKRHSDCFSVGVSLAVHRLLSRVDLRSFLSEG